MNVHCVVVAAGRGERLGLGPKALVQLGDQPLVHWATVAVARVTTGTLAVVAPDANLGAVRAAVSSECAVVAGGASRAASVQMGLSVLDAAEDDVVLIHDVARPLQTPEAIARVVAAMEGGARAAAPVVPINATVRRITGGDVEDVDRGDLFAMQTPQAARLADLVAAYAHDATGTDDVAAIAALHGWGDIVWVAGSALGRKITVASDLDDAQRHIKVDAAAAATTP